MARSDSPSARAHAELTGFGAVVDYFTVYLRVTWYIDHCVPIAGEVPQTVHFPRFTSLSFTAPFGRVILQ